MTRLHQVQINIPPPAGGDGREPGWKKNIHSENATRKIIRIDCVRTPRVGLLIRTFGGEQGGRFIVYKWGLPTKVTFVHLAHNASKFCRIFVRMDSSMCVFVHGPGPAASLKAHVTTMASNWNSVVVDGVQECLENLRPSKMSGVQCKSDSQE